MTAIALTFAGLAAALHVFIWTMESLTWKQPKTWIRFGLRSQAEANTTAPLAFNQGFYNLFSPSALRSASCLSPATTTPPAGP